MQRFTLTTCKAIKNDFFFYVIINLDLFCNPNPCANGGTCNETPKTCSCTPGFTGPTCLTGMFILNIIMQYILTSYNLIYNNIKYYLHRYNAIFLMIRRLS